jgi:hypothetical protein
VIYLACSSNIFFLSFLAFQLPSPPPNRDAGPSPEIRGRLSEFVNPVNFEKIPKVAIKTKKREHNLLQRTPP